MAYTFTRTGAQIEEIHNTVEDPKSNTQFSDDIRTIAGEYRGLWPDTGGSANKGDTYQTQVSGTPTGQYFTALQNTTVDPVGDDVNWRAVVSFSSISGANLLSNHNFIIASPDDSQPAPSATPRSYPPGFQIFSGVFANETTGITNLTYVDGHVSFSGGDFYMPVANTGAIARLTAADFSASVADFDGKPRTRGASFALVGDEYRVTVGVDALEDAGGDATPLGSVKFEQGSVATGHDIASLSQIQYWRSVGDVRGWGAVGGGVINDRAPIQSAIDSGVSVLIPEMKFLAPDLTINTDGQTIRGVSHRSVLIGGAGLNGINVKASHVTIRNLRMNGEETDGTNLNFAISTDSSDPASNLTVESVKFSSEDSTKGYNNAVKSDDNCNFTTMHKCKVERLWGNQAGRGYGFLSGNGSGHDVSHNQMNASPGRGRHGVYFSSGTSDSNASENTITGFDYEGISQYSIGAQPTCYGNSYVNNKLNSCCAAADNESSGAIGIYGHSLGVIVQLNIIKSSGERGVTVDGTGVLDCEGTDVSHNKIYFSGGIGLCFKSTPNSTSIGNEVYNSGQKAAGTYSNISIRSDGVTACDDLILAGSTTKGARSAVIIDPSKLPAGVKFNNNSFGAGDTATLELNGATVVIDGGIQFKIDNFSVPSISNLTSSLTPVTMLGADVGDVITGVSHTSDTEGMSLNMEVNTTGNGVLTLMNMSGVSKGLTSGSLRFTVAKRDNPL